MYFIHVGNRVAFNVTCVERLVKSVYMMNKSMQLIQLITNFCLRPMWAYSKLRETTLHGKESTHSQF